MAPDWEDLEASHIAGSVDLEDRWPAELAVERAPPTPRADDRRLAVVANLERRVEVRFRLWLGAGLLQGNQTSRTLALADLDSAVPLAINIEAFGAETELPGLYHYDLCHLKRVRRTELGATI
jgi:hypothetical protein